MWEKQLNQRLIVIGIVLVLAAMFIWPPKEKLRPGLDIAGGVSMIFEIQEEEGERDPYLAENMKRLLQKRVDPQGVYDLKWRVHGNNRIEVQMPLPPEDTARLREDYLAALEKVFADNIRRGALEDALRLSEPERAAELDRLSHGLADARDRLRHAATAHDEYTAALSAMQTLSASQPADSQPAAQGELEILLRDASEELEDAIDAVMELNLSEQRFTEVLEMATGTERRTNGIQDFKTRYPTRAQQIDDCVRTFDAWRAKRTFLDGPADLRRLLRGAGVLEFRILADPSPENPTKYDRYRNQLRELGPRPQPGDTEQWFRIDNPVAFLNLRSPAELRTFDPRSATSFVVDAHNETWYVLARRGAEYGLLRAESGQTPWRLKSVGMSRDQSGRRSVAFALDPYGGQLFRKLTGENVDKQLCILVDDVAYSSANIIEAIGSNGQISGDFSAEKLGYLIQTMQAGSLPARLKDTPVSERTIGSSLGQQNLDKAFWAGVYGFIVVAILMMVYYALCGAVANVALLLNIVLVLAAMALLGARFTLAGIAGIILTVGMAVDANILIFERMREEKERGASLRMIIKNGYDKAFSTIFDSNVTTLLTSAILYYVGSEEIKGFGLTLGWGICISLFTALYVTRTLFTLLMKLGLLTDIRFMRFIGVPNINWYGLRKVFVPFSATIILLGLALLWLRGRHDSLDIEFLGGVEAEVALKESASGEYTDVTVKAALERAGREIAQQAGQLASVSATPVESEPGAFRLSAGGIESSRLAAMIGEPLEEAGLIVRQGIEPLIGEAAVLLRVPEGVTAERVLEVVRGLAGRGEGSVVLAGDNIARANVGSVMDAGEAESYSVTTTATNKALVQHALVSAFGDDLDVQPRLTYDIELRDGLPLPIRDRRLEAVVPGLPAGAGNVADYLGGAAYHLTHISPPQPVEALKTRFRNMRLQPDYQDLPWRTYEVFAIGSAGQNSEGLPVFDEAVVVVADAAYNADQNPDLWATELATPEMGLVRAALDTEQTLRRVSQFKPQIANQSQTQALLAMLLSWAMLIGYMWVRFGRVSYGVAGVVAIVHDVCVALAFVGISGWIGGSSHPIGNALLIDDFKIDMTIVAAILTIIGYSINDTIVIFDRIRELRGRLGEVTPRMINDAVNQTFARTILTSTTTFTVVLLMYLFGGSSIRGFNFCMLVGILTGVYSTVAIAAPILLIGKQVRDDVPSRAAAAPA